MLASNNSPLLKDSQELTKTKGTIWKPLIAVSSLSIFSFISGQYLPYVIAAISGSGAIVAVPLAIFAVSTVVALISTIYLIRLAVSRADNKKEEPQKFVCENCINLENEPTGKEFDKSVKQDSGSKTEVRGSEHVPNLTPQQPPLTFGTAIPQNNNVPPMPTPTPPTVMCETQPNPSVSAPPPPPPPPMPPEGLKNWNLSKSGTTGEKPSVDTTQKKAPPAKKPTPPGGGERQNENLIAELSKKLESRRKGISGEQEDDVQQPNKLEGVYDKISNMIPSPRNRSSSVSSNSGNVSDDEDWDTDPEPIEQASSGSQSLHRERSGSFDSGHGSDDNVKPKSTSPPHSAPKADKPLISPKPANLKTGPQAPSATTVTNEAGKLPASSVKEHCGMFGGMATKFDMGLLLVR